MKTLRFLTITCLMVFTLNVVSYGQTDKGIEKAKYNKWSVTLSGGSMLFYGDIRQYDFFPLSKNNGWPKDISERKWGFGLSVNRQFTPLYGAKFYFQNGKLGGIKRSHQIYFKGSFLQYGVNGTVNLGHLFFPKKEKKFTVIGVLGFGYIDFKTRAKTFYNFDVFSYGYGEYGQKDKKTRELVIPLGFELRYNLTKKFEMGLDILMNNVNSDKLDGVVKPGSAKDKYGSTCLSLTYKIGKNEKSLDWVPPKQIEVEEEKAPIPANVKNKIDSLVNKLNEMNVFANQLQKQVTDLMNPPKQTDTDNDGVPDSKDLEPNTQAGNLVNFQGVSIPRAMTTTTVTGTASVGGMPLFPVFFGVNSTRIDAFNLEKVSATAKMLKDNANIKLDIVGNADKSGGPLYNEILSKKRAQAVYDLLVKSYGIEASRLNVISKGSTEPLSSDIQSVNRRVDFVIIK